MDRIGTIKDKSGKVVLVGAGNVGTHLGSALSRAGYRIGQVYSRNHAHALWLADRLKARPVSRLDALDRDAALYIICLTDSAIPAVLPELRLDPSLVVHTSGFHPMNILEPASSNHGVLYPLNTFSKQIETSMKGVPFCLEANTEENLEVLTGLSAEISGNVVPMSSLDRRVVHLAAVFACNFTNHMYALARELLEKQGLKFSLLELLIRETARKSGEYGPLQAQTGPAVRRDETIIRAHLELLKQDPGLFRIYEMITRSIQEKSN